MALRTGTSQLTKQVASPAQSGHLSPLDIAHVAYRAGFRGDALTTAVAVALAESSGNPNNVSPTNDYGLWQINKPAHPKYFKVANQIFNPDYNASAAFAISAGGRNWNPWTTYKTGAYKHYLGQGIPTGPGADKIIGGGSNTSGGGFTGILPTITNPIKWVDEAAKAIVAFIKIMVDPEKLGRHIGNALVWLLRQATKAIYNVIVLPPWRWSQRATLYYWQHYIVADEVSGGARYAIGIKAIVTMGFWATGFAILWGRFEPNEIGVDAQDSAFAGSINAGRNLAVARRITKPKDVEKNTATKPEPTKATIPLDITRTVAASRRRTVKVTNGGTQIEREDTTDGRNRDNNSTTQSGPEVIE